MISLNENIRDIAYYKKQNDGIYLYESGNRKNVKRMGIAYMNLSSRKSARMKAIALISTLLASFPVIAVWIKCYAADASDTLVQKEVGLIILLFLLLYVEFGRIYEAFSLEFNKISEILYAQGLTVLVTDAVIECVSYFLWNRLPKAAYQIAMLILQFALIAFWAMFSEKWCAKVLKAQPTAVICDESSEMKRLIAEYGLQSRFQVVVTASVAECLADLTILDCAQEVFLSGAHSHDRNTILKYCVENDKEIFVAPRIGDILMSGAKQTHLFHLPMLKVGKYMASPTYLLIKRILDIVLSSAAIIVLSPLMLLSALLVKATDGGPVFYKQIRLTQNGKTFEILKFRSMYVDAEKDGVARLSTGNSDPRVTPIGRILRKFRIDELPQLFNILLGDLSICGPRPERPKIAAQYCENMPEFALRLQAKAGLTGYAQVYGKYNTTPYDKLQMDLMYIAHPSIIEDFKIMFATIKVIFIPESTEGIPEGQITAERKTVEKML